MCWQFGRTAQGAATFLSPSTSARSASLFIIGHGKNGALRSKVGDRNVAAPCASAAVGFYRNRYRIGIISYDFYSRTAIWRVAPATTVAVGEATAKPTERRENAKRRVVGATDHVTPFVAPHTRCMACTRCPWAASLRSLHTATVVAGATRLSFPAMCL